jgi:hypothetical protein
VAERVLIDTSAWVAFFRGVDPGRTEVRALLADDRALRCGPVELELRRGLRRREAAAVFGVWSAVPALPDRVDRLHQRRRSPSRTRRGRPDRCRPSMDSSPPSHYGTTSPLLTLDHHFDAVPGVRRWPPEGG